MLEAVFCNRRNEMQRQASCIMQFLFFSGSSVREESVYKHLLVPIDGTELSNQTISSAAICRRENYRRCPRHPDEGRSRSARHQGRAQVLASGSDQPHEAIARTADEQGCDLIFMASPGSNSIGGLLLGQLMYYIREFPEMLHHPNENAYLFTRLRQRTDSVNEALAVLDRACRQR